MSEEWVILCVIITLLLSLILTTLGYVMYSGLMSEINIRTGSPPIKNITIAYKFKQGPYKDCGQVFTESCSIGPKLTCLGVFYDDPKKVSKLKCRYAVGSILSEGTGSPSEELLQLYQKFGFQIFSFPEVTHVVTTSVPHRTPLSVLLGVRRVYPRLHRYIKERKLCAHPFLEIYRQDVIHYMSPLARQGDFYVPEVRQVEMRLSSGNNSEDDRSSDITGADSNSEYSSGSGVLLSDSRESSLALSREASVPRQDRGPRDHLSDRSDCSSTASSFEALDTDEVEMDPEQDQDRNTKHRGETPAEERGVVAEEEE
ncbi:testis-expressed protein 264 isoform X1 [Hypomesus transpacificus]|uniref:testis-expressed protein 264 isoform X1 n=1 Tax=Hypomesus transpacificus TaxID=137520 RepID=UPI001F07B360|nr:testis-expressed protein 264 isoform X1 [Hypomesus transpacificus]